MARSLLATSNEMDDHHIQILDEESVGHGRSLLGFGIGNETELSALPSVARKGRNILQATCVQMSVTPEQGSIGKAGPGRYRPPRHSHSMHFGHSVIDSNGNL